MRRGIETWRGGREGVSTGKLRGSRLPLPYSERESVLCPERAATLDPATHMTSCFAALPHWIGSTDLESDKYSKDPMILDGDFFHATGSSFACGLGFRVGELPQPFATD